MIEKMTRYDFILLKGESEGFLAKLQELGVMDIRRSFKAIDEKSAAMLESADTLKKRMALLETLNYEKDSKYAEILAQLNLAKKEVAAREPWGEFETSTIAKLEEAGYKVRYYCVPKSKYTNELEELVPLQVVCEDKSSVWFVTVAPEQGYEFPLAECEAPAGCAADARAEVVRLEAELASRKAEIDLEAETIPAIKARYEAILAEADRYFASAATESAAEDMLTLVTGFAPAQSEETLCKEFDQMGIYYIVADATVEDNPPIKLRNNKFVRMFEVLTDMYGRPKYDGFDPTPYISIFFMLFFAMCMGDAGYGLVLIAVGALLKKVKSFKSLAPLVMVLGGATVVIGLIFHTFFSVDLSQLKVVTDAGLDKFMLPSKIAGYDGTMIAAIIIGIIHLCIAMIVKTIYATKNNGFLGSLATWGWTLFLVGTVAVVGAVIAFNLDSAIIKWSIIGLGSLSAIGIFLLNDIHRNPLINIGAGLWDTYNMATGVLGDVLSYLRLYALGLAGGMLGFAFNSLAKMALGDGGFGWIAFVLIALIGHVLNIAMAALGAFVHPLRLNFLEFFKNSDYDGSGRTYKPLKK